MTPSSLEHFLQRGRLGTHWDAGRDVSTKHPATANKKGMYEGYNDVRKAADEGFRCYAPDDATRTEPIYAALAGPKDTDRGAAPSYGNCWVELGDDVARRAIYNLSDSHASIKQADTGELSFDESMLLNHDDALAAKGVVSLVEQHINSLNVMRMGNLMMAGPGGELPQIIKINGQTPGYVEGAVFDDVTYDQVKAIHIAVGEPESVYGLGRLIRRHPDVAAGFVIHGNSKDSSMGHDWLRRRYGDSNKESTSRLWERLGLDPSSDGATVTQQLKQQASLTLRDLTKATYRMEYYQLQEYATTKSWHNYVMGLRDKARYKNDKVKQLTEDLIEIQQARVFFCEDVDQA